MGGKDEPCVLCGVELLPDALFCGECGVSLTSPLHVRERLRQSRGTDTAVIDAQALRNTRVFMNATTVPHVLESCEMPDPDPVPHSTFVLAIAGEKCVPVAGSGLVGRRPYSDERECIAHHVVVADPTRTVSKTHLEFGCEGASLWFRDRFSRNGSVLQRLGEESVVMEPGRRYEVHCGTRIEFGSLFLVVE